MQQKGEKFIIKRLQTNGWTNIGGTKRQPHRQLVGWIDRQVLVSFAICRLDHVINVFHIFCYCFCFCCLSYHMIQSILNAVIATQQFTTNSTLTSEH